MSILRWLLLIISFIVVAAVFLILLILGLLDMLSGGYQY